MKKTERSVARLAALLLTLILLTCSAEATTPEEQTPNETELIRQEITLLTNDLRRAQDLSPLAETELLTQAAQIRAEELASASLYAHTRPDGRSYVTVTDCKYVGENLHRVSLPYLKAHSLTAGHYAVDSWAASPGHLQNLTNPQAAAMGVGAAPGVNAKGQPCWYLVQLFLLEGFQITWVDAPTAP